MESALVSKDFPHPPFSTVPALPLGESFKMVRIDLVKSDFSRCYFNHNKAVIFFFSFEEKVVAGPDEGLRKKADLMKI